MIWLEKLFLHHLSRFTYLQQDVTLSAQKGHLKGGFAYWRLTPMNISTRTGKVKNSPLTELIVVVRERPGWGSLSLLVLWLTDPLAPSSWDAKCAVWGRWIHSPWNLFSSVAASSNNEWSIMQHPSEEYASYVDSGVPKSFWATSSTSCKAPDVK